MLRGFLLSLGEAGLEEGEEGEEERSSDPRSLSGCVVEEESWEGEEEESEEAAAIDWPSAISFNQRLTSLAAAACRRRRRSSIL